MPRDAVSKCGDIKSLSDLCDFFGLGVPSQRGGQPGTGHGVLGSICCASVIEPAITATAAAIITVSSNLVGFPRSRAAMVLSDRFWYRRRRCRLQWKAARAQQEERAAKG